MSEGVVLLQQAVDRLLDEVAGELPGPAALARLRTVLACAEQLPHCAPPPTAHPSRCPRRRPCNA